VSATPSDSGWGGSVRSVEQIARSLWRGRYLILACGLLLGLSVYAVTKQLPRRYTGEGLIAVDTQRLVPELEGVVSRGDSMVDPQPQVRSEVLLLRSPALLRTIADEMNLAADPEFNPYLRPPSLTARVIGPIRGAVQAAMDALPLAEWGIAAPSRAHDGEVTPAAEREAVVASLNDNLSIFNDARSLIISVTFTSEDPNRAAEIVNRLIRRYLEEKQESRAAANREGQAALQARLADARAELEAAERLVQQTRARHSLIAIRAGSVGQQRLEELTTALARAGDERARIEANWQRAQAMARTGAVPTDLADAQMSQNVSRLRDQEAAATARAAQTANIFGANHPDRRRAEAELSALRREIASEGQRVLVGLGAQAQAARAREAEIARQLDQAREEATRMSAVQAELQTQEKEADARRTVYQTLLQRVEQTSVEPRDTPMVGTRLVSGAIPPPNPSAPRPSLAGGIGVLAGFCIGGLVTLLRGPRRDAFRDLEDLAQETRLTALAAVPRASGWGAQASLVARVTAAPRGPEAEALRGLRTRLRFASPYVAPRSIAFVASVPGEGASSIAAAFARLAAADGLRVLLIEGDLQRPSLGTALGVSDSSGLIATLGRGLPWRDAVARDPVTSLDLLLVGEPPRNAHQLLESMRFQHLLSEACEEYNLVVLDAPPVTLAAEAMMLAHRVDATVLVVEAGTTRRDRVRTAAERLLTASAGVTATVLNRVAPRG
jgi:capsular exopolysaccharide synthesis family protein